MKLENKKAFTAKVIGVGKGRIIFNTNRLDDIKEALTRQDILDLYKDNAIIIREIKGRQKITRRKTRRRAGSIRKVVSHGKRNYITMVRRLRSYIKELKKHGTITREQYLKLRQEIRASLFEDKSRLKDRIKLFKSK